jgi:hypothetical protein
MAPNNRIWRTHALTLQNILITCKNLNVVSQEALAS